MRLLTAEIPGADDQCRDKAGKQNWIFRFTHNAPSIELRPESAEVTSIENAPLLPATDDEQRAERLRLGKLSRLFDAARSGERVTAPRRDYVSRPNFSPSSTASLISRQRRRFMLLRDDVKIVPT